MFHKEIDALLNGFENSHYEIDSGLLDVSVIGMNGQQNLNLSKLMLELSRVEA